MSDLPNIVFIVLDTMRKDSLGIYGAATETPNIDSFARENILFMNAISPAPWTIPAHASFFTGRYPSDHGIHGSAGRKVPEMLGIFDEATGPTIVEKLRRDGYNTIGHSANLGAVSAQTGFDRGFNFFSNTVSKEEIALHEFEREFKEEFSQLGNGKRQIALKLLRQGKIAPLVEQVMKSRRLLKQLKESGFPFIKGGDYLVNAVCAASIEQPFFLFVNLMEMHEPYFFDFKDTVMGHEDWFGFKSFSSREIDNLRRLYYSQAITTDAYFGKLMAHFKRIGVYDDSLIILTSDHGQGLKEKGFYGHSIHLHDEISEVPLIVKMPRASAGVVKEYQSTVNIHNILANAVDNVFDKGPVGPDVVFSESYGNPFELAGVLDITPERESKLEDELGLSHPRKAVFKNDFKLAVNGRSGTVEEFTLMGRAIKTTSYREQYDDLVEELTIFKGRERFTLPSE